MLTLAQNTIKIHKESSQDDLGGKMLLAVRLLVTDVVDLGKGVTEIWQSHNRIKLV